MNEPMKSEEVQQSPEAQATGELTTAKLDEVVGGMPEKAPNVVVEGGLTGVCVDYPVFYEPARITNGA